MKINSGFTVPKVSDNNLSKSSDKNIFLLSWSKINLFLQCPRCFYKEQVFKIKRPGIDPEMFCLHNVIDQLWKREFDIYRKNNEPHPLMLQNHIDAVPLNSNIVTKWRDYKTGGIQYIDQEKGIVLSGVIDDIWITSDGELIVVDYKTTTKNGIITLADSSRWSTNNKRQLAFYSYLLKKLGLDVCSTGYFICSKVLKDRPSFNNRLEFETTIQPYLINDIWVDQTIAGICNCLTQRNIPEPAKNCDVCKFVFC